MSKPMTVLQLLPELNVGGVERGTLEIARALTAAGHRALVVSGGGRLVPELEDLGATHIELPIGRKHARTLGLIGPLAKILADHEADIVHARSRLPAWVGWLARRRLPAAEQPRWVTTVHGPYTVNRYSRIMVSGQRVIAISEFIRDYITHYYRQVDHKRIEVIPRGVDTARYFADFVPDDNWLDEWRRTQIPLDNKFVIALPARLTRWKGQLEFIELLRRLRADDEAVAGVIIGAAHPRKPRYADELKTAVARAGIEDDVAFLGHRNDLREILSVCDCAMSLTTEPEAFGRTTIEALALGTPVIGYEHGGTGEILRTVLPRGLVPAGDIDAAVKKVKELMTSPWPVPREHPYSNARMQSSTLALYESLMEAPSD
ncbi:MAG: glycosyltransferase family 4 protein [Gammaproteobacteria bacterium]